MDSYFIATGIVTVCVALSLYISHSNRHYDRSKDVLRSGWGRLGFCVFLMIVLLLIARSLEIPFKSVVRLSGVAAALM